MQQPRYKLFISYSRADEDQKDRLVTHLATLQHLGLIQVWVDREIEAGDLWLEEIEVAMSEAEIAIFLIGPEFINSRFCQEVEVPRLLERHQASGVLVIPIIVGHCDWEGLEWIKKFQVMPEDGRPVRAQRPQSKAWTQVVRVLRQRLTNKPPRQKSLSASVPVGFSPPRFALLKLLQELPGRSEPLFGRGEVLAWLDAALADPGTPVVALIGPGGTGKSAIVRYWLETRKPARRFLGCSFFSQGTSERAASSDQFILQTLEALGESSLRQGSAWERGQRLGAMVASSPTVLVLDGLEPLQFGPGPREGKLKDRGIHGLLAEVSTREANCLCIVTSRIRLGDAFRDTRVVQKVVPPLSAMAARELLVKRGIRGTTTELDEAAEYLGHNALALVLAAEYLHTFSDGWIGSLRGIPLLKEESREGRYAKSVMQAYEAALRRENSFLDLELLMVLGLFDRPARWEWLELIRLAPAILGVNDRLALAGQEEILESCSRLSQWGMVTQVVEKGELVLDAHPLIREYFGGRLRCGNEAGWRLAHGRLFDHFSASTEEFPCSLPGMAPLFQAVIHGCKAGRHSEALHDIYLRRIMRGEEFYAARRLGAINPILSVLRHFFEDGAWDRLVESRPPLQQGLRLEDQILVLNQAGAYLTATRGYAAPEVGSVYSTSNSLCRRIGAHHQLHPALRGLWGFHIACGRMQEARGIAEDLLEISQGTQDEALVVEAHRTMGGSLFWLGEFSAASIHLDRAIGLYQQGRHSSNAFFYGIDPGVVSHCYATWALWFRGWPDQALSKSRDVLTLAQEVGHPFSLAFGLHFVAWLHLFRREMSDARRLAESAITVASEHGFAQWLAWGAVLRGRALVEEGELEEGIAQMRIGLADALATGTHLARSYFLACLGEVCGEAGKTEEAISFLDEALVYVREGGEQFYEAELHRIRGEVLGKEGGDEAIECFLKARAVAQLQGARSLELRACMSLERGNARRRRLEESGLRELYSSFSEGFETLDLREARGLLERF